MILWVLFSRVVYGKWNGHTAVDLYKAFRIIFRLFRRIVYVAVYASRLVARQFSLSLPFPSLEELFAVEDRWETP